MNIATAVIEAPVTEAEIEIDETETGDVFEPKTPRRPISWVPFLLEEEDEFGFAPDPADVVENKLLSPGMVRSLNELPDDQRQVMVRRFGLDNGGIRTLVEVAAELGMSSTGTSRLYQKALAGLRVALASYEFENDFALAA